MQRGGTEPIDNWRSFDSSPNAWTLQITLMTLARGENRDPPPHGPPLLCLRCGVIIFGDILRAACFEAAFSLLTFLGRDLSSAFVSSPRFSSDGPPPCSPHRPPPWPPPDPPPPSSPSTYAHSCPPPVTRFGSPMVLLCPSGAPSWGVSN